MISLGRMNTLFCTVAAVGALTIPAAALAQSVASFGDVKLSAEDVTRLATSQPGITQQVRASGTALQNLVRQELIRRALLQEARAKGLDKRADVAQAAELAGERVVLGAYLNSLSSVPANYPDEAAARAFFEANKAGLNMPRRFHLAQIFIARPQGKDAAAAAAAAELRAQSVATKAKKPDADFAALAKAESSDAASKDKGGDLGWFAESAIAPAIRSVLPQLKPASVSDPVATSSGWHIVRLVEEKPQAPATYEEARPLVVQKLRADRAAQMRQAYIDALLKKSPPQLDTAALDALRSSLK